MPFVSKINFFSAISMQSFIFANIKSGIVDRTLFTVPAECSNVHVSMSMPLFFSPALPYLMLVTGRSPCWKRASHQENMSVQ